ncbi:MAG: SprT family zinc-dependent metalloprotease [Ignavibacteria bacterium]|nr:M48 family metallopeptidase [Ignavibacteria bacterium]
MIKPDKIIRSNRKTVSIKINQYGELIVQAPKTLPNDSIFKIIDKYKDWISDRRTKILSKRAKIRKYLFRDDEEFLFLDKPLKLKIAGNIYPFDNKIKIFITDSSLIISERDVKDAKKLIEKFYRQKARDIFTERVNFYIDKYFELFGERLIYSNIRISSGEKTLGSCSAKNNLNFSWKLIQAPLDVIDYIVVHEIVHIKDKHHKKSFWQKVRKLYPDYKDKIKWLRENWFYLREFLSEEH